MGTEESRMKFQNLLKIQNEIQIEKQQRLDQEAQEKELSEELMAKLNFEFFETENKTNQDGDPTIQSFDHTYALVLCNSDFSEVRKLMKGMKDLPWTMNDLINARSTVQFLQIKPENYYELVDDACSMKAVQQVIKELMEKVTKHAKAGETVLVYCYFAGHGCSSTR